MKTTDYNPYFDGNPVPMMVYDIATLRFVKVNKATLDSYGYTEEEFLALNMEDMRPAEDVLAFKEHLNSLVRTGFSEGRKDVWRHKRKNGEVFYVDVIASNFVLDGKPCRLVQAIDVNDKVLAEQKNRQLNEIISRHEEELNTILSSLDQVVWSVCMETREVLFLNEACTKMFGYTPEEIKSGKVSFFDCIHPEDRGVFYHSNRQFHVDGFMSAAFRVWHKDGTLRYIKTTANLRKSKDGAYSILSGLSIDLTPLKRTEEALQKKAAEMDSILNGISDGFFTLDKHWNFTYVNNAFAQLYRCSREEIIGLNYWEYFPTSIDQKFYREYHKAAAEGVTVQFEEYAHSLHKWVSVSAYPTEDGLSVYFTDITDKRKYLMQIEQQYNALKEIAWLQSHQVRGPVASILGLSGLFNYDAESNNHNKEIMKGIEEASVKLDKIIREINEKTQVREVAG